jgi:hypothetical protein
VCCHQEAQEVAPQEEAVVALPQALPHLCYLRLHADLAKTCCEGNPLHGETLLQKMLMPFLQLLRHLLWLASRTLLSLLAMGFSAEFPGTPESEVAA